MKRLEKQSFEDRITYLIKPILNELQKSGGKLTRTELRNRICENDEAIASYEQMISVSKKTGKTYKKFNFSFNLAIKELQLSGYIDYQKYKPDISLTQNGRTVNVTVFDVEKDVRQAAKPYWESFEKQRKQTQSSDIEIEISNRSKVNHKVEESMLEDQDKDPVDEVKVSLAKAIEKMSPLKFEQFSRALLTQMGVEFTDQSIQISHDGGIDGYGYHKDEYDFRTTRVVIQCKRYTKNPVTEPDINQFLGAMNKFKADYGIFITNSRFTKSAIDASRAGSPITLIDGNDLLDLVIKYELFIQPVTTYLLDDFYFTE